MKIKHVFLTAIITFSSLSVHAEVSYKTEVIATGLDFPWCIEFLPNGDYLVTELVGNLRRISAGEVSEPIANVPPVFRMSQGGLFDVILDERFSENQKVYLSFADGDIDDNGTKVISATLGIDSLTNVEEVFSASPRKNGPVHYGGRMDWSNDGNLLITTGDGWNHREAVQDVQTHFGKVIEIAIGNSDRTPAFENAPLVYSYGHRNPQGLVVASDGTILLNEHGPRGGDEVNVVTRGSNYGWPAITYGLDYNGAYVSPFTEHPSMEQPIHIWTPSIAPSGLAIYEGDMFPEWRGDLFVGALVDAEVRRLEMENGEVVAEHTEFPEISDRVRDIRVAPDGSIFVLTDGNPGSIVRIYRD